MPRARRMLERGATEALARPSLRPELEAWRCGAHAPSPTLCTRARLRFPLENVVWDTEALRFMLKSMLQRYHVEAADLMKMWDKE